METSKTQTRPPSLSLAMDKPDPTTRSVLEPLTTFDLPYPRTRPLTLSLAGSLIYVGTHSGSLLLLSTDFSSATRPVSLTRSVSFGYSPIDAVLLLPENGKVLVLCDGSLFLTDTHLVQPVRKLNFGKGASFAAKRVRRGDLDGLTGLPGIAAGGSGGNLERSGSILKRLGGAVKANGGVKVIESLQLGGGNNLVSDSGSSGESDENNNLFVVLVGKKLVIVELVFGGVNNEGSLMVVKEIPCIEGVKTMVWVNDSIIVGTVNGYSLFSCVTGQSGLIFTLPDVTVSPLLKLLRKERKVLLLVDNVGVVVDCHGQPVGGSLVFRRSPDGVQELSSYLVVVKDGRMELHHKKSGACVQSVVFGGEGIGSCLIASEEDGHGQMVAVVTPTKVFCYRRVPFEEQIKDLLRKKNFKEAISLVEELESEGELSKEMLSFVHAQVGFLLLFDLHFEEAVNHFLQAETMQPSEVFPFIMRDPNRWSLLVPKNRYWGLHPPPSPLEDIVDDGLLSIQRAIFLRKAGVETQVDDEFLTNPPTKSELLELAIRNIIRYLEFCRQKDMSLPVREGVDTLLMYLYRALNRVDDMEKLASSDNCCIVEELESLLKESGYLRTLAFLYASKEISSKALAIWHILAKKNHSGLWNESTQDNSNNDVPSGREIAAMEATKILEMSSEQNLVLQHLSWIAEVNPVLAVQVLTSGKRENQLSPDEVIAAIDPKKVEILQRYLQWLIEDQGSNESQFHTLYALSLAKSAIEAETTAHNTDHGVVQRAEVLSIFEDPIRESLQIFLQSSDLYDPEEVLDLIEGSELWLEKAILYRKLGQERLVLQILALKLKDCEAAEQYCAEIGRPDAYMQLLDMYLDPQNGREPMFKAAVRLLHNHGELLDPLQVLETLSPDMPLQLAAETILRMLRARLHHYRQGQIVHNLSRALDVDGRLARLEERARHVQINDESLCGSCHARLGTKLFAMYPDDTVVCYKCFRRQGESTSVTGRDFKRDILVKPGWLVTR